jgi:SNF2 family DNA or RNA helicase
VADWVATPENRPVHRARLEVERLGPTPEQVAWTRQAVAAKIPVNRVPFPYQNTGVAFIESRKGRILLADDPGVGKTAQALCWLALHPEAAPALVVCPAKVRQVWVRECAAWLPSWTAASMDTTSEALPHCNLLVLSYAQARLMGGDTGKKKAEPGVKKRPVDDRIARQPWRTLILDEAHRVNNYSAAQTRILRRMAVKTPFFLALTGTPILSKPLDIQGVLRTLRPDLFPNKEDFEMRYCGGVKRASKDGSRQWIDHLGLTNLGELRALMATCVLRREKKDVQADLPKLRRVVLPADIDMARYRAAEDEDAGSDDLLAAEEAKPASVLQKVGRLYNLIGELKIPAAVEWIEDFAASGKSLVVFVHHHVVGEGVLAGVQAAKIPVALIDGRTTPNVAQASIDALQAGTLKVLILALRSGGAGITLTKASDVLFVERDWVPAEEEQGESRCDRIGQTEPVTSWYLWAKGTIDDDIGLVVKKKRRMREQVLKRDNVWTDDEAGDARQIAAHMQQRRQAA